MHVKQMVKHFNHLTKSIASDDESPFDDELLVGSADRSYDSDSDIAGGHGYGTSSNFLDRYPDVEKSCSFVF